MGTESDHCIIVTGMHKSGTSAVAGALAQCGLSIGEDPMPPKEENPKGFYENMALYELNERILKDIGHAWYSVNLFSARRLLHTDPEPYQEEIAQTIRSSFPSDQSILIKDPRLCLLFPLYERAIDREITTVLTSRPMEDIYRSLHRRSGMSRIRAYTLTKLYNYFAGVHTDECEKEIHVIDFDQFLIDPAQWIQSITASVPGISADPTKIEDFVDPDLNRSQAETDGEQSIRERATSQLASWWVRTGLGSQEPVLYTEAHVGSKV